MESRFTLLKTARVFGERKRSRMAFDSWWAFRAWEVGEE